MMIDLQASKLMKHLSSETSARIDCVEHMEEALQNDMPTLYQSIKDVKNQREIQDPLII